MDFKDLLKDLIKEKVEVKLDYEPDPEDMPNRLIGDFESPTVTYSTDQSEDPIGLVPLQASKPRNHLRVKARAGEFLDLATDGGSPNEWIEEQIKKGRPVAPPFLNLTYVQSVNAWEVNAHEGRSRTKTVLEMAEKYSVEIPLDLFLKTKETSEGYRANKISLSDLPNKAKSALRDRVIPQFNSPITSDDKSHVDFITHDFEFKT